MSKISVIIPIYNVEKYLKRCIDSVLAQTFQDFECILVDDGSPDRCGEICEEYKQKDSRIKVIHQENQGLGSARNSGLAIATGEFVCFIDSDDWIEPNYLKIMEEHTRAYNVDIVMCGFREVFFNEDKSRRNVDYVPTKSGVGNQRDAIFQMIIPNGYFTSIWNKLIKRECIFNKDNTFYPFENVFGEDERWWMEITQRIHRAYFDPTILYNWVKRRDGICGTNYYDCSISKSLLDTYDNAKLRLEWFPRDSEIDTLAKAHLYSVGITLCERAYFLNRSELYKKTWNEIKQCRKYWMMVGGYSTKGKIKRIVVDVAMHIGVPHQIVRKITSLTGRK